MDFSSFYTFLNSLGTWTIGSLVLIDLLAATTNAFNGAILASRRDHRRNWTIVGIILIAVIGGIGGGVSRDVLLNTIPGALTNPWYLILCLAAAGLAFLAMGRLSGHGIRRTVRLHGGLLAAVVRHHRHPKGAGRPSAAAGRWS